MQSLGGTADLVNQSLKFYVPVANLCYNLCCKSRCILSYLTSEPHHFSVQWLKRSKLCQLLLVQTFWKSTDLKDLAPGFNLNPVSFTGHQILTFVIRLSLSYRCTRYSLVSVWDMPGSSTCEPHKSSTIPVNKNISWPSPGKGACFSFSVVQPPICTCQSVTHICACFG